MNDLELQIAEELRRKGPVPFARFMDQALYCPDLGYYERKQNSPGRRGDYYTSVSVGPLFGQLLGFQCAAWAAEHPDDTLQIVECGAHDGRLALDLLDWLHRFRPSLSARLQYWIVEPSARRRAWQAGLLEPHRSRVTWIDDWSQAPPAGFTGVILCNELLDAFPVHCLRWDAAARRWREWGVDLETAGRFTWTQLAASELEPAWLPTVEPELAAVLPEGFRFEVAPEAARWWRRAARALRAGRMVAFDYGCETRERLLPTRSAGTLRAYAGHHQAGDVLADVGEQDLTAHVDWSRVREAGEAEGLVTDGLIEQGRFLTRLGALAWREDSGFGEWTTERTRQFQTLVHPAHLGAKFQVLVQRRGPATQDRKAS